MALCRSVLSNTICPYLIFTLRTLEEKRGGERRVEKRRGEERSGGNEERRRRRVEELACESADLVLDVC